MSAVDLFGGAGGWEVALRRLGHEAVGIEFDHAACETRRAAGLETIEGDVRDFGPMDFPGAAGLIASPPCQTFSTAGRGSGRAAMDAVLDGVRRVSIGDPLPTYDDVRTGLVLEPLRWALSGNFRWLAFEQVPAVLPVWQEFAQVLRERGWSVDTGCLTAEQYGVPQTRRRAFLVASRDGEARLPEPTHRKYRKGVAQDEGDQSLKPWVSMAEALGWGRPAVIMRSNYGTGGDASRRGERSLSDPGPTVTSKAGRNRWMLQSARARGTVRSVSEPSPTITAGHDAADRRWVFERPATTVVGSFRPDVIAAPGWRKAGDGPRQNAPGSIRVSVEEAATLQTFPADYPWQGSKTKQFQQIGNAVPPLLAEAVLSSVIGES